MHPQDLIEAALGYPVAWDDTAAWVQAVGSVFAIWAAGRIAVLQQRLARESAIEGILGTLGLVHSLLAEAAALIRDRDAPGVIGLQFTRYDDALAWITGLDPTLIGHMGLVELVAGYPPLLRRSRDQMRAAVRVVLETGQVPENVWMGLHDLEQRSAGMMEEAGRILTRAQSARRLWLFW